MIDTMPDRPDIEVRIAAKSEETPKEKVMRLAVEKLDALMLSVHTERRRLAPEEEQDLSQGMLFITKHENHEGGAISEKAFQVATRCMLIINDPAFRAPREYGDMTEEVDAGIEV